MTMSKLCSICGCEIPEGEEFVIDGQAYCHDCFDDLFIECDYCGSVHHRAEMTEVYNADLICPTCLERDYTQCDDCGKWYLKGDMYTVNRGCRDERHVCVDCLDEYERCDSCDEYYTENHIWAQDCNGTHICDGCSDNYYICADCGSIIFCDDVYWHEEDEDTPRCYSCYCNYDSNCRRAIHDYGYKPDPIFGTTDSSDGAWWYEGSELTFGVELECDKGENPSDAAEATQDCTDRVYCKHDGSLDHGYEIVTMPGTLAWHMKRFPWADITDIAKAYGFTSHDAGTCGLHIHIGRAQLGSSPAEQEHAVANLILLVDNLWPEIVRFSRRKGESRWANRNDGMRALEDSGPLSETDAAHIVVRNSYYKGRYLAVNTQNSNTVELRFNRGTLKVSTILASLQLASNLALFAKDHTMDECLDATWEQVVNYQVHGCLLDYVRERFSTWYAESRPTTTFRVAKIADTSTIDNDDLLGYEARCKLVSEGADILWSGDCTTYAVPLRLGDIVVYDGPELGESGPRVGSIGVCVDDHDTLCPTIMWNLPAGTRNLHDDGRGYAERCYCVARSNLAVIRTLRNGTEPANITVYKAAVEYGFVPGDLVRVSGWGYGFGILYGVERGYLPVANIAWPSYENGHNGPDEYLRRTPYRNSGWNFAIGDVTLV